MQRLKKLRFEYVTQFLRDYIDPESKNYDPFFHTVVCTPSLIEELEDENPWNNNESNCEWIWEIVTALDEAFAFTRETEAMPSDEIRQRAVRDAAICQHQGREHEAHVLWELGEQGIDKVLNPRMLHIRDLLMTVANIVDPDEE